MTEPRKGFRQCTFDGCGKKRQALDLCSGHYQQHRQGKPLAPLRQYVYVTRDGDRKSCTKCGEMKTLALFVLSPEAPDGRRSICKRCHADAVRFGSYGIDRSAFEDMLAAQGGCAICDRNGSDEEMGWAIDHDHSCCPGQSTCGECIRGVLCRACNTSLGGFEDNIETMLSAIAYIRGWQQGRDDTQVSEMREE